MRNQDWYDLGDKVQNLVQDAINSKDFRQLNENITRTLDRAVRDGGEVLRNVFGQEFEERSRGRGYTRRTVRRPAQPEQRRNAETQLQPRMQRMLYSRTGGPKAQGIMEIMAGAVLLAFGGFTALGILVAFFSGLSAGSGLVVGVVMLLVAGAGGFVLSRGLRLNRMVNHFRWFCTRLRGRTYCEIQELSRYVGKSEKEIRRELCYMISKGWFRQGHLDSSGTTLITSNQTYEEYQKLQKQREELQREQEAEKSSMTSSDQEVQEVLERGTHYLRQIKESNEAIPGELISEKISHMETVVQRILLRAKEHPEVIKDLDKLMDYYLPTTVKLLDAYEEMVFQPVQGENIRNSKKEIEDTLDTLNIAFEKILDSIFQNEAWDISSDISVLHTILAQEGLTRDDFQKMK